MKFIWSADIECEDKDNIYNVITLVHWRCTAVDDNVDLAIYGTVKLGDPDPNNFVLAPDDITEKDIKRWVENHVEIELELAKQLQEKILEPPISIFSVPLEKHE